MSPRVVRAAAFLLLGMVMVLLVQWAARPVTDPDAWWHIRLGDELWGTHGAWGTVNHWSSFATEDFIASSALSELIAAKMEDWWGLPGIAWLAGAAMIVLLVAVYLLNRRVASELPAALVTAVALLGASGSLGARPETLSFILVAVTIKAWFATESDLRPRWWLVPFTWVWAMLHGFWIVGVIVGFVFAIGLLLGRRARGTDAVKLFAVPALSLVVTALTPIGPKLLVAPFTVADRNAFVEAGRRTAFDRGQPWVVLLMMLLVVLIWAARRDTVTWSRVGLLVTGLGWLLVTERTVALGAIFVAPLLAAALQSLMDKEPRAEAGPTRAEIGGLTALTAAALVGLGLMVPQTSAEPGDVPSAMDRALGEFPRGTTVLNHYNIGGWLAWQHPNLNVVIDPSILPYPLGHIREYLAALDAEPGWERFVESTGAELAILKPDDELSEALERQGWRESGADEGYVLLVSPSAGDARLRR